MLYPFRFKPIFKPRIWGGRRLAELFDKPLPPGEPIGESWELSPLAGDESRVANGPLAGTKITELVNRFGADLLGGAALSDGQFPLLVKLLDARQQLSVQVHPNADLVNRPGSTARLKNECWYVIAAEPGARIWLGLNDGVDRGQFAAALAAGTVEPLLHVEPARAGSFFYLPAGTVHALGGGIVVAEVQTPSDTTYRLFDWNRVDPASGKPRPLHVAEGLEAISFSLPRERGTGNSEHGRKTTEGGGQETEGIPGSGSHVPNSVTRLVRCESFMVDQVRFRAGSDRAIPSGQMLVWQVLGGRADIRCDGLAEPVAFCGGELVLLPAALAGGRVTCREDCTWLEITVPAKT